MTKEAPACRESRNRLGRTKGPQRERHPRLFTGMASAPCVCRTRPWKLGPMDLGPLLSTEDSPWKSLLLPLHPDWVLTETQVKWVRDGRSFVHQHPRGCRLVRVPPCRPGWPIQHEPRAHPRPELDSIFALETQARALAGDPPPNMASECGPSL